MTISPGSSRLPSRSTVSSVILPAGNMTHTPRGFSLSVFVTSSSERTAVAPSFASISRGLALASKTTQLCPAFIRRRAMLPPMRPNPMMPICMCLTPQKIDSENRSFERRVHGAAKLRQSGIDVFEVHAERAAIALDQDVEVAAGLRRLHHTERVGVTGHADIVRGVAG